MIFIKNFNQSSCGSNRKFNFYYKHKKNFHLLAQSYIFSSIMKIFIANFAYNCCACMFMDWYKPNKIVAYFDNW